MCAIMPGRRTAFISAKPQALKALSPCFMSVSR